MGYDVEGNIYIPLEEFWTFVSQYNPSEKGGAESIYGKPRIENNDLVISYAASTDCHPKDWAEKPKALKEWDEFKIEIKEVDLH
jgi:hypothetical protein